MPNNPGELEDAASGSVYATGSGRFRMIIAPTKKRLKAYLISSAARSYDFSAYDSDLLELQKAVKKSITECNQDLKQISSAAKLLQDYNEKWLNLLAGLTDKALEDEDDVYVKNATGEDGLIALVDEAFDVVAGLEAKLDELKDYLKRVTEKIQIVSNSSNSTQSSQSIEPPRVRSTSNRSAVHLQTLQMMRFDGDPRKFGPFMDLIDACVLARDDLRDIEKLAYVIGQLDGRPKDAVSGFEMRGENLKLVLDMLKEKFGTNNLRKKTLQSDLLHMARSKSELKEVRRTFDRIEQILREMKNLGEDTEHWQVVNLVESKLPQWVLREVFTLKNTDDYWNMEKLLKTVEKLVRTQEEVELFQKQFTEGSSGKQGQRQMKSFSEKSSPKDDQAVISSSAFAVTTKKSFQNKSFQNNFQKNKSHKKKLRCTFCNSDSHLREFCDSYKSGDTRKKRAIELGRCGRCVSNKHSTKNCEVELECQHCQEGHLRTFCQKFIAETTKSLKKPPLQQYGKKGNVAAVICEDDRYEDESSEIVANVNAAINESQDEEVLLMSKEVDLVNPEHHELHKKVLAFLDQGSMITFIHDEVAKALELSPLCQDVILIKTFGAANYEKKLCTKYEVKIRTIDNHDVKLMAYGYNKKLTSAIRTSVVEAGDCELKIEDGGVRVPGLLIGVRDYNKFIRSVPKLDEKTGFYVTESKIGPVASGAGKFQLQNAVCVASVLKAKNDRELKNLVEKFYALEVMGVSDEPTNQDDLLAEKILMDNIRWDSEANRYEVPLLWKVPTPMPTANYGLAYARLKSFHRELMKNREMVKVVDDYIKERVSKKVVEVVSPDMKDGVINYLPFHIVMTPDKVTTKIRPVFDGSCKINKGARSLNDCLLKGPQLMADLVGMILRSRTYRIILFGDLEKAYHSIGIRILDRNAVRFLWLIDPYGEVVPENIIILCFCAVAFGLICATYLLAGTIKFHLEKSTDPVAKEVLHNLYADNCMLGANTIEEAVLKYKKSKTLFASGGMNMREYISNNNDVNLQIPEKDRAKEIQKLKILGVGWKIDSDELVLKTPDKLFNQKSKKKRVPDGCVTKRMVLQFIGSFYDPLGLLCPMLLKAKLFLQKLWRQGLEWDEVLQENETQEWMLITEVLLNKVISIPRLVVEPDWPKNFELHAFCDASGVAFSVAIYLRQNNGKAVNVNLVYAKSRLKPLKDITIPRMELLGATMGAKAVSFVENQLQLPVQRKVLWTDSRCVLAWILSEDIKFDTFVENRVRTIRSKPINEYRYVPTNLNPSDDGTRGVEDLVDNIQWWHGPTYLLESEDAWPPKAEKTIDYKEWLSVDEPAAVQHVQAVIMKEKTEPVIDFERYGSLQKLLWVLAFVFRFVFNSSRKIRSNKLLPTIQEMKGAERYAVMEAQRVHPPNEAEVAALNIQEDEIGILRCFGRFSRSELKAEAKNPIFLSKNSKLTELVILDFHQKVLHFGVQHTLSAVREKFWIPHGKSVVKKALRKCMLCRKVLAKPYPKPKFAPLPRERVNRAGVYENLGLDNFGPVNLVLKEGLGMVKCWGVIYTCLVTRNVYLDLVMDLSAESFLKSFRRFVANCGRPNIIWSDNGTNFVAASTTIQDLWNNLIQKASDAEYFTRHAIQWKRIPQLSPWFGGSYERLVKSVKEALRKAIGRKRIGLEDFWTLLAEVAAVLNTRPLTFLHDELDSEVIRPIDFVSPKVLPGTPPMLDGVDAEMGDDHYLPHASTHDKLVAAWRRSSERLELFWKHWHDYYLKSLRESQRLRHKNPHSTAKVVPVLNEVVLIHDNLTPRGTWKLGRIIELQPGADQEVRVAKVKTPNGHVLTRSVDHLYPLEISEITETEEAIAGHPDAPSSAVNLGHPGAPSSAVNLGHPGAPIVSGSQHPRITRSRAKIQQGGRILNNLKILPMVMLYLFNVVSGARCPQDKHLHDPGVHGHLVVVDVPPCVEFSMVVKKQDNGCYCWEMEKCKEGHLVMPNNDAPMAWCGAYCACPSWSEGCSHYNGKLAINATLKYTKIKDLLEKLKPSFCAKVATEQCPRKTIKRFPQIQLYDGSLHLVTTLNLVHNNFVEDEYKCIGDGQIIDGSPHYCKSHPCDLKAKKFCYYGHAPVTYLETDGISILIKAWGNVDVVVYEQEAEDDLKKCETCSMFCQHGGVQIELEEGIQTIEVCSQSDCYQRSFPPTNSSFMFSPDIISSPYEAVLKIWSQGIMVKTTRIQCKARPFCEDSTWLQLVQKPNCAPSWAVAVMVALFYVIAVLLTIAYLVLKMVTKVFKIIGKTLVCCILPCRLSLKLCATKKKPEKQVKKRNRKSKFDEVMKPKETQALMKPTMFSALVPVILILMLSEAHGCSETRTLSAIEEQCFQKSNQQWECIIENTTLVSVPPIGQELCFLLKDANGRPSGSIKILTSEVEFHCDGQTLYYTREAQFNSISSKLCNGEGSCYGNQCATNFDKEHVEVKELGSEANSNIGFTRCTSSCGGWFCKCWNFSEGCLFWRVFMTFKGSKGHEIFELAECQIYQKLNVTVTISGRKPETHQFKLTKSRTSEWNGIRVTLNMLSIDEPKILQKRFITDGSRTAILTDDTEAIAKIVKCNSTFDMMNRNCHFDYSNCDCNPAHNVANCICNEQNLEKCYSEELLLPHFQETGFIFANGKEILSHPKAVAAEIQLTLKNFKIQSLVELNNCKISNPSVQGCFGNCPKGAVVNVTCSTDFGIASAHINCPSHQFPVVCTPDGHSSVTTIYLNDADIDVECEVICPASTTTFRLKGQLHYLSINMIENDQKIGHYTEREFYLPGVWRIFKFLFADLNNAAVFIGYNILIIFTIYLIFKCYCTRPCRNFY